MATALSILETNVLAALRTFILSAVTCEVIVAQTNRVAMPKGDFITMTSMSQVPLSTNTDTWDATTKTVLRPTQFTIQLDCYGTTAANNAQVVAALLRDDFACQSFKSSGFDIQPLYAGDAQQMPLISGEDQYINRWTFNCVLQANPTITLTQQTANALTVGVVNVERTYPP
jgi:hypothetical protein